MGAKLHDSLVSTQGDGRGHRFEEYLRLTGPAVIAARFTYGFKGSDPRRTILRYEPDKDVGNSDPCPPPLRMRPGGPAGSRAGPGDKPGP